MDDWVKTLETARTSMGNIHAMSEEPDRELPLHVRLIGDLYRINRQHDGVKILFNVQMAAIGLYFILKGCRPPAALVCNRKCCYTNRFTRLVAPWFPH